MSNNIDECKNKLRDELEEKMKDVIKLYNKSMTDMITKEYNELINKKEKTKYDELIIKNFKKQKAKYNSENINKKNKDKINKFVNELLDEVLCNPVCKDTLYDTTIDKDKLSDKYEQKYKHIPKIQKDLFRNDDLKNRKNILENNMMDNSFIVETELLESKSSKLAKLKEKGAISNCRTKKETELILQQFVLKK